MEEELSLDSEGVPRGIPQGNNRLTFVTFTQLNCEQPALVYGLAGN